MRSRPTDRTERRTRATGQARRAARPTPAVNDNNVHPGGAYTQDTRPPHREYYSDPRSLLNFIDHLRFARAICGRETTAKPSKSNIVARETGFRLYPIVVSLLGSAEKDLYRKFGLSCAYADLHRLSRRLLIPLIDQHLAERRNIATVPEEFIEMLTDAIKDKLWREHGEYQAGCLKGLG